MRDAYSLRTWLWLPRPRAEVFAFFADAFNLQRITPPFLGFEVVTPRPIAMYAGRLIDYRIKLHGLPMRWRTEISAWEPDTHFIDRQLSGPYQEWVHSHRFSDEAGGTRIEDHVRYRLWGPGPVMRLIHGAFIAPDLQRIFEYRHTALLDAFTAHGAARMGPVVLGPEPAAQGTPPPPAYNRPS